MLDDGQFVCVDCHYVTSKRSNWFKHRRKHLGMILSVGATSCEKRRFAYVTAELQIICASAPLFLAT